MRKCPYCDFNSFEAKGGLPEDEYVAALLADLEQALPLVWGRRVYSVFFGGGTPSLFSAGAIDRILSAVRARLPLEPDAEITLEANPGTAEAAKFEGFRAAGVNRLSLGVQSFDDRHLVALGRIHDGAEARRAVELAKRSFDNFNLDLMYALPGQTTDALVADLDAALAFGPPHLSIYHLTLEPNTYFYAHPPVLPDDDTAARMQERIEARLAAAGYIHYEVSAFARRREARGDRREAAAPVHGFDPVSLLSPGASHGISPGAAYCLHNLNYWLFGDYLGIGAGAHSKLSSPAGILRQMRWRQPRDYIARAAAGEPVQEQHEVAAADIPFEFMMNALRLTDGFPAALFAERTGLALTAALAGLDEAERRGFVTRTHSRVVPTERGRRFLNDLLQIFLPAPSPA